MIGDHQPARRPPAVADVLARAASLLGTTFTTWARPTTGADHLVLLVATAAGARLVLKAGADAAVDAHVLALLNRHGLKVPALLAWAPLPPPRLDADAGATDALAVMTEVTGTLLAEVAMPARYLAPLIAEMRRVHAVTTAGGAGPVLAVERGPHRDWGDYLRSVLTGEDPEFRWDELARHPRVDARLLGQAREALLADIQRLGFAGPYRLLHGDLNPANVFVDTGTGDGDGVITGIIDWSYARYGDPLFDFARLRMNPFIRMNPAALAAYWSILGLRAAEREREACYYRFHLLEYVNWYYQYGALAQVEEQMRLLATELNERDGGVG